MTASSRAFSLVAAAVAGLLALTPSRGSGPRQAPPEAMLGMRIDQVLAAFGLPDSWQISAAAVACTYAAEGGGSVAFVFHDDVAIKVPAAGFAPARLRRLPSDSAYSGQRVAEAILRLGNPHAVDHGSQSAVLRFADDVAVTVAHGRVFF